MASRSLSWLVSHLGNLYGSTYKWPLTCSLSRLHTELPLLGEELGSCWGQLFFCWYFYLHFQPYLYSLFLWHMQAVFLPFLTAKMTLCFWKNVMVQNPDLQPKASMEVSHGSHLPSFGPTTGWDSALHMHGWQQPQFWCPLSSLLIVFYRLISPFLQLTAIY